MKGLPEDKRTSQQWQQICLVTVLDPDGWDRKNMEVSWYEELITRQEFERRLCFSTCDFGPDFRRVVWADRPVLQKEKP